jgi:hypothetical protein
MAKHSGQARRRENRINPHLSPWPTKHRQASNPHRLPPTCNAPCGFPESQEKEEDCGGTVPHAHTILNSLLYETKRSETAEYCGSRPKRGRPAQHSCSKTGRDVDGSMPKQGRPAPTNQHRKLAEHCGSRPKRGRPAQNACRNTGRDVDGSMPKRGRPARTN